MIWDEVKECRKAIAKGNKVKATVRFKGRQLAHTELGEEVLNRFKEGLNEVSVVEMPPKFEFKAMYMILAPKK